MIEKVHNPSSAIDGQKNFELLQSLPNHDGRRSPRALFLHFGLGFEKNVFVMNSGTRLYGSDSFRSFSIACGGGLMCNGAMA